MKSSIAVARRELKTFFASPIAYIVLVAFLLLAGWLYFSTLFLAGQASLRGFFSIAPVLFVVLVPAITMRSIAEERKTGTLEVLLTMPMSTWHLVIGKFLAAMGMISVGLLWTVPYAFTVSSLTGPGVEFDWGPVIAGYVGLLLLSGSFAALGLWASALSKNQIVGFVISLVICFAFYFIDKFALLLPDNLGAIVEYLSVDYHFENIARGVLDSRDVLYYASLIGIGLLLTAQALSDMRVKQTVAAPNTMVLAAIGICVLVNVVSIRYFFRQDMTSSRMYTLSAASKETVNSLDDTVTMTAYFTNDLPAPYSSNARYLRDLLEEYRAASKGKVAFEFIDPTTQETDKDKDTKKEVKRDIFGRQFREQTSIEKELAATGVQSVEVRVVQDDQQQTKRAYMGLVIRHNEKKEVLPVIQSVAQLEYEITSLIRKMTRPKTPVIAVLQGHEEPKMQEHFRQLQGLLARTYEIRPVELGQKDRFDADVDALFVLGPKKALAPNEVKAIDQFLMEGKSVAMFLDTMQIDPRTFEQAEAQHGLGPLLASYGITIGDQMVADTSAAPITISDPRNPFVMEQIPYPFMPIVKAMERESVVSMDLGQIPFPFVSKITTTASDGKQIVVLAKSSAKSWTEAKPQNLDPRRDWRTESANLSFNGPHDLMVQVTGKLKSHFAAEAATSAPGATPMLAESKGESRLIVAGTSQVIWDEYLNRSNATLMVNIADWMLMDPALLAVRKRGVVFASLKPELSDGTRNSAKFGNAFGLPLTLAAFGLIRWRMRETRRQSISL